MKVVLSVKHMRNRKYCIINMVSHNFNYLSKKLLAHFPMAHGIQVEKQYFICKLSYSDNISPDSYMLARLHLQQGILDLDDWILVWHAYHDFFQLIGKKCLVKKIGEKYSKQIFSQLKTWQLLKLHYIPRLEISIASHVIFQSRMYYSYQHAQTCIYYGIWDATE